LFEDGNGRIGRAISEKSLAQGLAQPALTSSAPAFLARGSSHYNALEAANNQK
jgi:Fic family protein